MKVRVLYFASVRERIGLEVEEVELPGDSATLAALRKHLQARGQPWSEALAEHRALRAAVNQDMATPSTALRPGDEVAFFPPVTGG